MADIDLTSSAANLVVLDNPLKPDGVNTGDLMKALYNLTEAIYALCNNLDTDAGTLGTDFLAKVGTPLNTALLALLPKPSGDTTAA